VERLILVTSRAAARGGDVVGQVARALEAVPPGSTLVQLREKDRGGRELATLAAEVVAAARARGARVVVNDRLDVALACGADGVHLPESGMDVAGARSLLGTRALIGASVHDVAGAATRAAADYLIMGPVWETPGKAACGVALLAEVVRAAAGRPVFAVGGVDVARADEAAGAGAWGVAVIRAVMAAEDAGAEAAALLEAVSLSR
jgi:thiamine-phosphate pyrophosphorylase